MKFRSRADTVEAEQFFADKQLPFADRGPYVAFNGQFFYVTTIHGNHAGLRDGDWVVLEREGLFRAYPVRADVFERRWEPIASPQAAQEPK